MKKIKYLLVLCIFAIISTGCVKYNATMAIKKDKSMEFTIIYAIDKSLFGDSSGGINEDDMESAKREGFTVEKYTEGSYEGFKLIKKVKNIDDVSIEEDVEYSLSDMLGKTKDGKEYIFKVEKGEKKNTYTAKFVFDSNDSGLGSNSEYTNEGGQALPDEKEENDESIDLDTDEYTITNTLDGTKDESNNDTVGIDDIDISKMTQGLDLSFNVTLPYGAVSSNATTKEDNGNKLVWKLSTSGTQAINFTFELDNDVKGDSNLLLYVGIGAGVLLLVVIVVVLIMSSKKKKVAVTTENPKTNEVKEENK